MFSQVARKVSTLNQLLGLPELLTQPQTKLWA